MAALALLVKDGALAPENKMECQVLLDVPTQVHPEEVDSLTNCRREIRRALSDLWPDASRPQGATCGCRWQCSLTSSLFKREHLIEPAPRFVVEVLDPALASECECFWAPVSLLCSFTRFNPSMRTNSSEACVVRRDTSSRSKQGSPKGIKIHFSVAKSGC